MIIKKRRLIYVDASFNNETKEAKISLFDPDINKLDTLNLKIETTSLEAELYAILYAILYVKKNRLCNNKIHVLNDNTSAVNHQKIQELCKDLKIGISWIPREANIIADKGTKLEVNKKEEEVNLLIFFYELIISNNISTSKIDNLEVVNQEIDIKKILFSILDRLIVDKKSYISIGEVGKVMKSDYPNIKYTSLKKLIEKYPKDFIILKDNNVKKA